MLTHVTIANGLHTAVLLLMNPQPCQPQVRGFYRGLSSPLIGGAAETGVNYLIYSRILNMFKQQQHHQQVQGVALLQPHLSGATQLHQQLQHQQQLHQQQSDVQPPLRAVPTAGAVAGVALSVILSPTELVKCRMQVGQHTSPLACLRHVVQTEGLWGLSRGFKATLCREVPGNALFFTGEQVLLNVICWR